MPASVNPERARLEALVAFGEKRLTRAGLRFAAADRELSESRSALLAATGRLVLWIEANPDPQIPLPLDAATNPEGENL